MNFSEFDREPSGKVNLIGRVKYVHRFIYSFFFGMLIVVSGVILTWASDIIPNFSSRSSPTDILEKEVLIRIPRINVKYMYCMDMCKLNCVNYIFRCDH